MKYLIMLCIFGGFVANNAISQTDNSTFSLQGQFTNLANEKIFLVSSDFSDSAITDMNGNFHFANQNINKPLMAYLRIGKNTSIPLYLTLGYSLVLQANHHEPSDLYNSLKISGTGSIANSFWIKYHAFSKSYPVPPLSNAWYDIPAEDFINTGLNSDTYHKFIAQLQSDFKNQSKNEPDQQYFENYSIKMLKYQQLWYLLKYAEWNDLDAKQTDLMIKKITGNKLRSEIDKDKFLENSHFGELVRSDYLLHVANLRTVKSKTQYNEWTYPLEVADVIYKGEVKNYVMDHNIRVGIANTFNLSDLKFINRYIQKIEGEAVRAELYALYEARKSKLEKLSPGIPAPDFDLLSPAGQPYRLSSFLGQVVLIDLWASWCGPCKAQMPYLKEIKTQFGKDSQLQLISIAVSDPDGEESRLKFINENDFDWLHLDDKNDFVHENYQVRTIPRFILIDKKGKFISSDAPFPKENRSLLISMIQKALDE